MKVYYNLLESNIFYEYKDYKFTFSTEFLLNKFKSKFENFIYLQNARIKVKYNLNIDLFLYFLFSFYIQTEKRGFLVYKNDIPLENIEFEVILKE